MEEEVLLGEREGEMEEGEIEIEGEGEREREIESETETETEAIEEEEEEESVEELVREKQQRVVVKASSGKSYRLHSYVYR
jgi:uncharacterized membrane protein YdbT with pleckstrin-like domain